MGREVRMVPADWQHPKDRHGNLIPLHEPERYEADAYYHRIVSEAWNSEVGGEYTEKHGTDIFEAMIRHKRRGYPLECQKDPLTHQWSEGWTKQAPKREDYMPEWQPDQRTHLMMYETCSEGTPLSPAFATPEELARWLADNGASAFGYMTASYDDWLATCRSGFAVSAVIDGGELKPGVGMAKAGAK